MYIIGQAQTPASMPNREICLPVGIVGWSQDSISDSFGDGEDIQIAINALRSLTKEQQSAILATYEPIRVVEFVDHGWITLDNRRLHIFRALSLPGTRVPMRVATSEEAEELKRKVRNRGEGATIVVRSNQNSRRLV